MAMKISIFQCYHRSGCGILVSNSIKEISKYRKLEVNTDILPGYFLKTDVNSGDTFFKDIHTLAFFEYGKINRSTLKVEKGFFRLIFSGKVKQSVKSI